MRRFSCGRQRSDLDVEKRNTLKIPGVNAKARSLIFHDNWITFPDTDGILTAGVNEVCVLLSHGFHYCRWELCALFN